METTITPKDSHLHMDVISWEDFDKLGKNEEENYGLSLLPLLPIGFRRSLPHILKLHKSETILAEGDDRRREERKQNPTLSRMAKIEPYL